MIYSIIENPYIDESTVIVSNGVSVSSKAAKLNEAVKRPAVKNNWQNALRAIEVPTSPVVETKTSEEVLNKIGISLVNFPLDGQKTGAKKLRTNPKAVNEKCKNIYLRTPREDVMPTEISSIVEAIVQEDKKEETGTSLTPNIIGSRGDVHGRHEKTAEIPVVEIQEAVNATLPPVTNTSSFVSRAERNTNASLAPKQEVKQEKAGDMDLYNKLVHNGGQEDDVVRQLQGARSQLSKAQGENEKLTRELSEAEKELQALERENRELIQKQEAQNRAALTKTLRDYDAIQEDNLAKTNNLYSIREQIEKLRAEKQAREASMYDNAA